MATCLGCTYPGLALQSGRQKKANGLWEVNFLLSEYYKGSSFIILVRKPLRLAYNFYLLSEPGRGRKEATVEFLAWHTQGGMSLALNCTLLVARETHVTG